MSRVVNWTALVGESRRARMRGKPAAGEKKPVGSSVEFYRNQRPTVVVVVAFVRHAVDKGAGVSGCFKENRPFGVGLVFKEQESGAQSPIVELVLFVGGSFFPSHRLSLTVPGRALCAFFDLKAVIEQQSCDQWLLWSGLGVHREAASTENESVIEEVKDFTFLHRRHLFLPKILNDVALPVLCHKRELKNQEVKQERGRVRNHWLHASSAPISSGPGQPKLCPWEAAETNLKNMAQRWQRWGLLRHDLNQSRFHFFECVGFGERSRIADSRAFGVAAAGDNPCFRIEPTEFLHRFLATHSSGKILV